MSIVARRARDTGDLDQDFVFPLDEDFTIAYAYNNQSSNSSVFSRHQTASSLVIKLKSDGTAVWGEFSFKEALLDIHHAIKEKFLNDDALATLASGLTIAVTMLALN